MIITKMFFLPKSIKMPFIPPKLSIFKFNWLKTNFRSYSFNISMAGIASGISKLAVGSDDTRRRSLQPQTTPDTNTNTDTDKPPDTNTDSNNKGETSEEFKYVNSAKQDIKGLTNLTGYVKGNANGVINFGRLTASDPSVQP
ncbi:hypothetical protein V8G54_016133 [Vigna mungo]|uniref:Uncharacterized protein n=1 Tax=Vigna mungo TaxID=3915 RepID=A0AAQ3NNG9_VIGMU